MDATHQFDPTPDDEAARRYDAVTNEVAALIAPYCSEEELAPFLDDRRQHLDARLAGAPVKAPEPAEINLQSLLRVLPKAAVMEMRVAWEEAADRVGAAYDPDLRAGGMRAWQMSKDAAHETQRRAEEARAAKAAKGEKKPKKKKK